MILREQPLTIADPSIFPARSADLNGFGGPLDQLYGARAFDQYLVLEGGFGSNLGRLPRQRPARPARRMRGSSGPTPAPPMGPWGPYVTPPVAVVPGTVLPFAGESPFAYIGRGLRGLGKTSCPEGAHWDDAAAACLCDSGRVWTDDHGKCVSPQSLAQQAGRSLQENVKAGGSVYSQQELSANARRYIEGQGHSVSCEIDPNWFAGPQGGQPSRVCSIDGGPYQFAAYSLNLNPGVALVELRTQAAIAKSGVSTTNPYNPETWGQVSSALTQIANEQGPALKAPASTATTQQSSPPPATSSSGGSQYQTMPASGQSFSDITVEVPGGDSTLPGVSAWSVGAGGQYQVFGVPVPQVVTAEWIPGIPNWALLAGALAGAYIVFRK